MLLDSTAAAWTPDRWGVDVASASLYRHMIQKSENENHASFYRKSIWTERHREIEKKLKENRGMELCRYVIAVLSDRGMGEQIPEAGKKTCGFCTTSQQRTIFAFICPGFVFMYSYKVSRRRNEREPVVKESKRFKRAKFTHIEGAIKIVKRSRKDQCT
jgi:hypothetical protein